MPGDIMGDLPGAPFGGGAPCRPRCTACILANMSCETLSPLPLLVMVEAFGLGFLAALRLPSGVDEVVMEAAVAPDEDMERTPGRGGSNEDVEEEGAGRKLESGGEEGDSREGDSKEGDSRGLSESKPPSGVEAMMARGSRSRAREAPVEVLVGQGRKEALEATEMGIGNMTRRADEQEAGLSEATRQWRRRGIAVYCGVLWC